MRTLLAVFSFLWIPGLTLAQSDAASQSAQAAQQAAQQSQQAAMQAMRDAQEANRQASEASQQAMQDAQNSIGQPCCLHFTAPPKFSVKPGTYPGPTTVKITDSTRGAVIYYTTDGWTPTLNSPRYRGPVLIDSTTTLQAIAIAPYGARSPVTSAQYIINGASPAPPATSQAGQANAVPVRLVFDADVTSQTASVGDKIPMLLAEDIDLPDLQLKKGAPATVIITQVDPTGPGGAPGNLSFEADALQSENGSIPLRGGATREGVPKPPNAAVLIPVVGPLALFKHGKDAVIAKGTPFTAFLNVTASQAPKE
jgi:hypothetical protein